MRCCMARTTSVHTAHNSNFSGSGASPSGDTFGSHAAGFSIGPKDASEPSGTGRALGLLLRRRPEGMLEAQIQEDGVAAPARADADREGRSRNDLQTAAKVVGPA